MEGHEAQRDQRTIPAPITASSAIGRGIGSGKGKTSGRGGKGQTARTGVASTASRAARRRSIAGCPSAASTARTSSKDFHIVNLGRLQQALEAGRLKADATVDGAALVAAGVLRRVGDGVRLLAKGELKAPLTIEVAGASKAAIAAVEKLGGKVIVAAPPKPAAA